MHFSEISSSILFYQYDILVIIQCNNIVSLMKILLLFIMGQEFEYQWLIECLDMQEQVF